MSRTIHLGELLVRNGVITSNQRDAILEAQSTRGGPFGALAEEMFGVNAAAVERAWAQQYSSLASHVDPRTLSICPRALDMVNRRQAWQFCILPVEMQGRDLLAVTTQDHLVRALKFAGWRLGHGVQFLIAEPQALGEALCQHYPMAGMTPSSVSERGMVA